jgi:hypothetical protein
MNCATARNRILALPDPAAVPAAVSGHVSACAGCAAWHRLLIQVEGAVAAMPVPAGDGIARTRVVEKFRTKASHVPPAVEPAVATRAGASAVVVPGGSPMGDRLARLWPFGLVAAALLVGALSWVYLGGKPQDTGPVAYPGPDPMLDRVVAAKIKIDTAETATVRLEGWSDFATAIHDQAKALHKVTPDQMKSLADMYEKVVNDGAMLAARDLSPDERQAALPRFTETLLAAEQEANRLALEAPPASDEALRQIAAAAQIGRQKLALLQQRGRA